MSLAQDAEKGIFIWKEKETETKENCDTTVREGIT